MTFVLELFSSVFRPRVLIQYLTNPLSSVSVELILLELQYQVGWE